MVSVPAMCGPLPGMTGGRLGAAAVVYTGSGSTGWGRLDRLQVVLRGQAERDASTDGSG